MNPSKSNPGVDTPYLYHFPPWTVALLAVLAVLVYLGFARAIDFMIGQWHMDEFSQGYLIPLISVFLIWRRREALQRVEFKGAWSGVAVVLAGLALDVVGRLSALYTIQHIALLIVIAGVVLALAGWEALKLLGAPLGVLIFMVPLPNVLLNTLSAQLQLLSSAFGVWMMRLANVPVLLQGNVIDLGSYQLEVAEACSGLRYLLPLMTLAFLMACFFRVALWKRLVLFLSSMPLTLLMNSLRIASIGVMVDQWGSRMAQGLLHQVQGWMMFMLCTVILLLEVMLLSRLGRRQPWREVFGLDSPALPAVGTVRRRRALSAPLLAATAVVALFSVGTMAMPAATLRVPARESFTTFPLQIGHWSGQREALDQVYLNALNLDDYLLANYVSTGPGDAAVGDAAAAVGDAAAAGAAAAAAGAGAAAAGAGAAAAGLPVNLYVAWYDTQRPGDSTHSPKACLPGGGWRINDMRQIELPSVRASGQPLRANRVLIQYGDQRQLVYYWFQQRGRVFTSELMVKWYLLVDALRRHRTDGALVRLIVPLPPGGSAGAADRELQAFARVVVPKLGRFIPN
ncbi:MAG TPA: EpsI family protein [Steroidobacteraceae bacterium]|nr:EpsI family protein [Steroidobacteraceae bacterium]